MTSFIRRLNYRRLRTYDARVRLERRFSALMTIGCMCRQAYCLEQQYQENERLRAALNRSSSQTGTYVQPSYLLYVMQEESGRQATGVFQQRPMAVCSVWQSGRERVVERNP